MTLLLCFSLNMLGRGMSDSFAVFVLPLGREFGWSRAELMGAYSISLLVFAGSGPFAGALPDGVDEVVDPRHVLVVGSGEPGQAQRRPFDRDGGVAAGEVDDGLPGAAREGARATDGGGVEVEDLAWA